jgi:hypothetical protein
MSLLPDTVRGTLLEVHHADIHGQPNLLLVYAIEDDPALQEAQLATTSVYREPRPGDSIVVHRVMGEAVEVRKAED